MQWSPHPVRTAAVLAGAVLAGVAVLVVADWPGRLLLGTAAVGLLVDGVHDLVARPRLAASPDGVVTRTWGGRHHLPWAGLRVRVRTSRRLGFRTRTLELDTAAGPDDDGVLVVLGRRDVAVPLEEVARALRALDPTA